jgi:Zn-finger nucleic acid-binding protein
MGQDVWAESPDDSCEHAATVVSVTASEVTVIFWAHTNEKVVVDIDRVRPMFAFESWVRTEVLTNTNVKQSANFRGVKVSLKPDRQDANEEIVKLQAALTAANRKAEMQQAEIEKLRWKNLFQTDEILGMKSKLEENKNVIAWYSNKLDAMKKYDQDEMELVNSKIVNQEAKMMELEGCLSRTNTKIAKLDEKKKLKKRNCVPLKQPLPSKFQGDAEKAKATPMPKFADLVNFPAYIYQTQSVALLDGMRFCVMCGQACQCNGTMKGRNPGVPAAPAAVGAIIPTQNKGICNACDVKVWVVVQSGLEIKWCKRCKNFRSWVSFGDKGLATKCVRCREHQQEKYALQKEAKEKKTNNAREGV